MGIEKDTVPYSFQAYNICVIKTATSKQIVLKKLKTHIDLRVNGMRVIRERYEKAIEEVITMNELQEWTSELGNSNIDDIIRDIGISNKNGSITLRSN